jgi:hypothetical protein
MLGGSGLGELVVKRLLSLIGQCLEIGALRPVIGLLPVTHSPGSFSMFDDLGSFYRTYRVFLGVGWFAVSWGALAICRAAARDGHCRGELFLEPA